MGAGLFDGNGCEEGLTEENGEEEDALTSGDVEDAGCLAGELVAVAETLVLAGRPETMQDVLVTLVQLVAKGVVVVEVVLALVLEVENAVVVVDCI